MTDVRQGETHPRRYQSAQRVRPIRRSSRFSQGNEPPLNLTEKVNRVVMERMRAAKTQGSKDDSKNTVQDGKPDRNQPKARPQPAKKGSSAAKGEAQPLAGRLPKTSTQMEADADLQQLRPPASSRLEVVPDSNAELQPQRQNTGTSFRGTKNGKTARPTAPRGPAPSSHKKSSHFSKKLGQSVYSRPTVTISSL